MLGSEESKRILIMGRADLSFCDNRVSTAKYTVLTFLPIAIREQFRRNGNIYFFATGFLMAVGYYTNFFQTAISPFTTLGPLAVVVSISLAQEGAADLARHRSDNRTNRHPCVVIDRSENVDASGGERDQTIFSGEDLHVRIKGGISRGGVGGGSSVATGGDVVGGGGGGGRGPPAVVSTVTGPGSTTASEGGEAGVGEVAATASIAFERVKRMNIRAGQLLLVRNRDMIPVDLVLLASSGDGGNAYIETSSIDGETNLKLRTSPHIPRGKDDLESVRVLVGANSSDGVTDPTHVAVLETIEQAVKRITRMSVLGHPFGESALLNPINPRDEDGNEDIGASVSSSFRRRTSNMMHGFMSNARRRSQLQGSRRGGIGGGGGGGIGGGNSGYVATLTSEAPNVSVNTYSGKLTLPPFEEGMPSRIVPLGADNILLRGAVLRNTEWVIGMACFTGKDTKLVMNSVQTPSKFSGLDRAINRTVFLILFVMVTCVVVLAGMSVGAYKDFYDQLWYAGYNEPGKPWPYFPNELDAPDWDQEIPIYGGQVFLFITLLNNFVPLSLYMTVEVVTLCMMLWIGADKDLYHEETDTPAVARSTIVTDLGQVRYIFSDKTGTLTQNVMRFKRCSVDGMAFGAPVEKSAPDRHGGGGHEAEDQGVGDEAAGVSSRSFHPLRQLLLGPVDISKINESPDLTGMNGIGDSPSQRKKLTFNAEMFLRVMSICHTVVVEKDFDDTMQKDEDSVSSKSSLFSAAKKKLKKSKKKKEGKHSRSGNEQKHVAVSEIGSPKAPNEAGSPSSHSASRPFAKDHIGNGDDNGLLGLNGTENSFATTTAKGADGAPYGHNYQAESPDEGALVSAASLTYDFQFIGRDSSGIKIACSSPSLLADPRITNGLKDGTLTPRALSAETASPFLTDNEKDEDGYAAGSDATFNTRGVGSSRLETWTVLAVNKFDSDRKRMSVLVRSPPELGSVPMLLCKGADSSMLDRNVCASSKHLMPSGTEDEERPLPVMALEQPHVRGHNGSVLSSVAEDIGAFAQEMIYSQNDEANEWEMATMLGIQAHLGDFASEGLRTLVLGVRIIQEDECDEWLESFRGAASSIKDRDKKLTEVALAIEQDLHIVGATAIEDKLQDGVPETIATLEEAGIKLWVLTGDKRETAIEIGYSTRVLTPKMHLTEVSDGPVQRVRTLMAMEFIRLVKGGKLVDYQHSTLDSPTRVVLSPLKWKRAASQWFRAWVRIRMTVNIVWIRLRGLICCKKRDEYAEELFREMMQTAKDDPVVRRKAVRDLADKIIKDYLISEGGKSKRERRRPKRGHSPIRTAGSEGVERPRQNEGRAQAEVIDDDDDDLSLSSDTLPAVFNRAQSARAALDSQRNAGQLVSSTLRSLSIASVTSRQSVTASIIDEDMLSLASFLPDKAAGFSDFDKKKRTVLEKLFAVDRHVRHGRLGKHLHDDKLSQLREGGGASWGKEVKREYPEGGSDRHASQILRDSGVHGPRALVIEGAALTHLLGDPEHEEMLFAVASACDAVIACRVSPKQKAMLVRLVRKYVSPTPVTLAIGDGANDVGMIQEAHVGIGISGLEGQQAVNSSDFAIAQFRFLRDLLLIHGRWNFIRLCKVALFSFYKNAVMAGTMIVFQRFCMYSGTPLYDQWVISSLNFVAGWPILFTGLFDRDLEKDYVRRNPIVYASGPNGESISLRVTLRWIVITIIHIMTIFYISVPILGDGGGVTSAFTGLMSNDDLEVPGDGEGGDMKVFGTTIYTTLIFTLAYKVFFESKSIINGEWPAFTCRKGVGEGWPSRLAYTWIGIWWLSIGFYFFFAYIYGSIGRDGASTFSQFTMVSIHTFNTRSITWLMVILIPTTACTLDVVGKLFSNLYYPTQTQIHMEIQAQESAEAKIEPSLSLFSSRSSI